MSRVHGKFTRIVHELITTITLAWKLADTIFFFKFSLFVLLKKFVISPENRKKKQIKQKNKRNQCNMTFPRMRVTIVQWTNKNNSRAYLKYLGCEKVKLANVAWNHSCKNFRSNDSACADQFQSFAIDQQHFKYKANTSAFLKDLQFSIKLSGVTAISSTLECQGKKQQQQH